jgi:hypothetical protein
VKITRSYNPHAVELSDFADRYGLTLTLRRDYRGAYQASFHNAEVVDGAFLRSEYGSGLTEGAAITKYARAIAGKRLVINAYHRDRIEIDVPHGLQATEHTLGMVGE